MTPAQLEEWQQILEESRKKEEERLRERMGYPHQFKIGDGATTHIGSDAQAWTVINVTASGKTITIQGDKATLSPDWRPDIVPGGFAGHCTNNYSQTYDYERDENGPVRVARLTKRGWSSNGLPVTKGRHAFHDYNF